MPLHTRQLIPPLTLRTVEGRVVHAWDFKQKKSLVIAFLDANCPTCDEFLGELKRHASGFAAHSAVTLVAFLDVPRRGATEALPPHLIVGVDPSGRSARAFLGDDAVSSGSRCSRGVFVTDRYGELAAIWPISQHEFPAMEAIRAALRGVEIACEECCMPQWPTEA